MNIVLPVLILHVCAEATCDELDPFCLKFSIPDKSIRKNFEADMEEKFQSLLNLIYNITM